MGHHGNRSRQRYDHRSGITNRERGHCPAPFPVCLCSNQAGSDLPDSPPAPVYHVSFGRLLPGVLRGVREALHIPQRSILPRHTGTCFKNPPPDNTGGGLGFICSTLQWLPRQKRRFRGRRHGQCSRSSPCPRRTSAPGPAGSGSYRCSNAP